MKSSLAEVADIMDYMEAPFFGSICAATNWAKEATMSGDITWKGVGAWEMSDSVGSQSGFPLVSTKKSLIDWTEHGKPTK